MKKRKTRIIPSVDQSSVDARLEFTRSRCCHGAETTIMKKRSAVDEGDDDEEEEDNKKNYSLY